jgi:hypothetical protein
MLVNLCFVLSKSQSYFDEYNLNLKDVNQAWASAKVATITNVAKVIRNFMFLQSLIDN